MGNTKRYGLYIGRFQSFHEGHANTIQKIMDEGYEPVIFIKSITGDSKNPLSPEQRQRMIQLRFPDLPSENIHILNGGRTEERGTFAKVLAKMGRLRHLIAITNENYGLENSVLFYHGKDEDKLNVPLFGKVHINELLSRVYPALEVQEFTEDMFERIYSATAIRENFGEHRQDLHPAVENYYVAETVAALLNNRPIGADSRYDRPIVDATTAPLGETLGQYQLRLLAEGKAISIGTGLAERYVREREEEAEALRIVA